MVGQKVALITGGASGIGLAVGALLQSTGNWKICVFDLNEEAGKKVASDLKGSFYKTDVNNYESLAGSFDKAFNDHGKRFDFVFANAGIVEKNNFYEQQKTTPPPPLPQLVIDINLKSVLNTAYLAQHYFRLSKAAGVDSGALVMTASTGGLYATSQLPAYSAAKFGVMGLMHSMAPVIYHKDKIRASCICPGSIRTNLLPDAGWDTMPQSHFTKVEKVASVVKDLVEDLESSGKAMEIVGEQVHVRRQQEYSSPEVEFLMEDLKKNAMSM